jgi:hypothetical protein
MKFIIHASIWDMILLLPLAGFAIVYFVLWGLAALKDWRMHK